MTARSGHAARLGDRRRNGIMSRHTTAVRVTPRSSGQVSARLRRPPSRRRRPRRETRSPRYRLSSAYKYARPPPRRRPRCTHLRPLSGLAPPCEAIYMRQSATLHRQEHTNFRHTGHENQASLNLASLFQSNRPTGQLARIKDIVSCRQMGFNGRLLPRVRLCYDAIGLSPDICEQNGWRGGVGKCSCPFGALRGPSSLRNWDGNALYKYRKYNTMVSLTYPEWG